MAAVSAGYFLAASREMPQGVATFFAADIGLGWLLWCGASLSFVMVQAALWTPRRGVVRAVQFLIATLLMASPPFGITGWGQPMTAAGVLFPGWGWMGLALTVFAAVLLTTDGWRSVLVICGLAWIASATSWISPALPPGWIGLDLNMGARLGRDASFEPHRQLSARVREVAGKARARVVVLPESALGIWTPTVERLWQEELLGQAGGARAHGFATPVVHIGGVRIAPLIC